jgi:hypothetical protein
VVQRLLHDRAAGRVDGSRGVDVGFLVARGLVVFFFVAVTFGAAFDDGAVAAVRAVSRVGSAFGTVPAEGSALSSSSSSSRLSPAGVSDPDAGTSARSACAWSGTGRADASEPRVKPVMVKPAPIITTTDAAASEDLNRI